MAEPNKIPESPPKNYVSWGLRAGVAEGLSLREGGGHEAVGWNVRADLFVMRETPFFFDSHVLNGHRVGIGVVQRYAAGLKTTQAELTYGYVLLQGNIEVYAGPAYTYVEAQNATGHRVGGVVGIPYRIPLIENDCKTTDCSHKMAGPLMIELDLARFSLAAELVQAQAARFVAGWEPTVSLVAFF